MSDAREAIMAAAEALFAERGYTPTGVRDICGQAQATPPSLYHFFGSKENLLLELVRERYGAYSQELQATLTKAQTPLDVCRDYVRFVFSRMRQAPVTAKFVFGIMFGPQQDIPREAVTAHLTESSTILTQHLRRVAPKVAEQRLIFAAVVLHGMITPVILQFLVFGTASFPDNMADCFGERAAAILTDDLPVCKWPER